MKINGLIWTDKIIEKIIIKHHVDRKEVHEVFNNNPYFRFIEKGYRLNENVYAVMGITESGRYLIIFFIYKTNKKALILSAREMTKSERKKYEQR